MTANAGQGGDADTSVFVTPQGGKHSRRPPLLHCWIEPGPRVREALLSAQVRFVDHQHARSFTVEQAVEKGYLRWPLNVAFPEPAWAAIRTQMPFADYPQVLFTLTPSTVSAIENMTVCLGPARMALRGAHAQGYVSWRHERMLPRLELSAVGLKYPQHTPVVERPPEDGPA